MSWHFSQALVEAYSADTCSAGVPSAPSSSTPTRGTYWSPGKTMDASKPSRSGMTFKPLTDDRGEAVLMSCLEAFPVRTFPVQERERESKENEAPCGNTWQESSAKFDLASSSWKTHQCLWEEDLPSSSLILPKWGMMRSGVLWERTTPGLPTSGTESGSWGTPRAGMGRSPACHYDRGRGNLEEQVGAAEYAKTWPTPCARDHKGVSGSGRQAKRGNPQDTLCNAVAGRMWPTPKAQDAKNNGSPSQMVKNTKPLNAEVGGQLNPTWVEWLMNWPLGWTDCAVSVTDKFQQWQNSHGKH
jgi:hypothetical protein